MKLKLSNEANDDLDNLVNSAGYVILLRVIEDLAADIDRAVLSYNLSDGPEGLVTYKARSEGARKLQRELKLVLEAFKASNKPSRDI